MFFCILFNYTILRDTKDVLVVTAPGSGAEIIPFLKTWCERFNVVCTARTRRTCAAAPWKRESFCELEMCMPVGSHATVAFEPDRNTRASRSANWLLTDDVFFPPVHRVNLPMAIGFMFLYAQLANMMSTQALFYTIIVPFIAFFGSFAFVLYPLRDVLHPTNFCDWLLSVIGDRFSAPVAILRNWTFCLFYVMAELWGSVVVSVLFWGFANQITTVDEAKQFYPLFGLGANVALIFSGRAVRLFSEIRAALPPGVDGWGLSLKGLMGMVVVGGALVAGTYWAINNVIIPSLPANTDPAAAAKKGKKKKVSMPMGESLKYLAESRYVRDLATLVVAYGISINLVEVTWKSKIKAQYPNPNDYSAFMGDFSSMTGIVTFTMMLVGRWIFKRFGWGVAAAITPTVILITGIIFFALVLSGNTFAAPLAGLGMTPLLAAVYVGAAQNIFSKASKYSLFDPCKEMAYIPLDEETKVKGKAAIDVVCNPLGKSGGALIQQVCVATEAVFPSFLTADLYLLVAPRALLYFSSLSWASAAWLPAPRTWASFCWALCWHGSSPPPPSLSSSMPWPRTTRSSRLSWLRHSNRHVVLCASPSVLFQASRLLVPSYTRAAPDLRVASFVICVTSSLGSRLFLLKGSATPIQCTSAESACTPPTHGPFLLPARVPEAA